ncbi:MAG: hypothetical protein OXH69_19410 [Acidobacteria bacterium]|nr:hypothetical protein [Acidobacteriota bacterium]
MRRCMAGALGIWLLAGATLVAADFWEEKDFTAWSDEEVQVMLTASPWTRNVTILTGVRGDAGPGDAGDDLFRPGTAPHRFGGGTFSLAPQADVTVAWSSALPVKQALVRRAFGLVSPIPHEGQQMLAFEDPFYAVTVVGLPPSFDGLGLRKDAIRAATMLARRGRAPLAPENILVFADGAMRVTFQFPKTDPITLDDGVVEFMTTLGPGADIRTRFELEAMIVNGRLEL